MSAVDVLLSKLNLLVQLNQAAGHTAHGYAAVPLALLLVPGLGGGKAQVYVAAAQARAPTP